MHKLRNSLNREVMVVHRLGTTQAKQIKLKEIYLWFEADTKT